MKKSDFILNLSADAKLSKADAKTSTEIIIATLTKAIVLGERVEIRGFGSFYKKYRPTRLGINPKTGKKIQIEEKFVAFFKSGKSLREIVNTTNKS